MSKIKRFCQRLENNGADAALISSDISRRYLSGFDYSDGYILATPAKAYLLADFRYIEAARQTVSSDDFQIIMPQGSMAIELSALIEENRIRHILIEDAVMPCRVRDKLSSLFPDCELIGGASSILGSMMEFKDEEELSFITEAQRMTDLAFEHIVKVIRRDMTERDVALELEFFMRKLGSEGVAFDTIAVSGSASSMPHGVPRNVKLENGFLTMDFGAKYKGYCADMTRTVVIGRADEEMKRLYGTVLKAQTSAIEFLCEGVECRLVDKCARDIINSAGYEGCFGHSLGHGVGLLVHEAPRFSQGAPAESKLSRGHVVTVEPGIYIAGKYGCRIEDMIAVRASGEVIDITNSPKELIELC